MCVALRVARPPNVAGPHVRRRSRATMPNLPPCNTIRSPVNRVHLSIHAVSFRVSASRSPPLLRTGSRADLLWLERKAPQMVDVHELLDAWLANVKDEELLAELKGMKESGNEDAITDAFFQDLEFGTAGLRGTLGAGTNRMNIYTVGRAT